MNKECAICACEKIGDRKQYERERKEEEKKDRKD